MKKLFYNGTILTMDDLQIKQAMLIENGVIMKTGTKEELEELAKNAERFDLEGHTVLPGFIDAHSHLTSYANSFLQVSLTHAESFTDVIDCIQKYVTQNHIEQRQWIIANGYDHNKLLERTHPTKKLLDEFFPEQKVVLQHQSGHFGVFNTAALQAIGMTNMDRNGYLEESRYIDAIKKIPVPDANKLLGAYQKALKSYASYGITTVQEGMLVSEMLPLYQMLLSMQVLTLDVVGYPQLKDAALFYNTFPQCNLNYHERFKLGGYKIFLDGSPQGKTAWMKTVYKGTNNYGVSTMSDQEVIDALNKAIADKRQIIIHCNGDAAAEQLLNCAEKVSDQNELARLRPVIIHAQLIEREQLIRVKKLGFIPSFFVAHCYYWGDVHIQNLGFHRAQFISPAKSALKLGICFTFHQDTPVIEPDMMQTIWCAVNRKTREGIILGEQEQISVYDALLAVTRNAAYQYGEEETKGTLSVGKKADFIILDHNPLEYPKEKINEIKILNTFQNGECIFMR